MVNVISNQHFPAIYYFFIYPKGKKKIQCIHLKSYTVNLNDIHISDINSLKKRIKKERKTVQPTAVF